MAHDFTYKMSDWATSGEKAAPSATLKSTGFTGGMKPPASVFNYQWDRTAKAVTELQEYSSSLSDEITSSTETLENKITTSVSGTKSVSETVTLISSSWSDGKYTYSNAAITTTNPIEMIPNKDITSDQLKALQKANIIGGTQKAGSIELVAMGTVPTISIPVDFIIRRDL